MIDALNLTLREAAAAIRTKQLSPVELTQLALARITADEPKLNAYVCVTQDQALAAARQAESEITAGHYRGELHGLPVAVKDLYDMAGIPTSCSSKVRHDQQPAEADSACVERLQRAGAVIVGKAHTHEFAYGAVTPTTANPWNLEHIPGGSSGGSAATVAARGCFMAMGTDTAGSIRIPAAVCGIVGLKPTYGRVSRFGVASLSWSLDHAGPLTRTVGDAAASLGVLAGYDPRDPGSADVPVGDYLAELEAGVEGLRIGVPRNFFFDHVDADVARNVRDAIERLKADGAQIVQIDVPLADQILPVEFGLMLPEASSYHYKMLRERAELYEEDVRIFLELGAMVPATDYIAALRQRTRVQAAWKRLFEGLDAVIAPTVPAPAARRDQASVRWPDGTDEAVVNVFVRLTSSANVTGLPSVAVPCGFSANGLPTSFQVIGRPFKEARILRIARAYERTADWGQRRPAF